MPLIRQQLLPSFALRFLYREGTERILDRHNLVHPLIRSPNRFHMFVRGLSLGLDDLRFLAL